MFCFDLFCLSFVLVSCFSFTSIAFFALSASSLTSPFSFPSCSCSCSCFSSFFFLFFCFFPLLLFLIFLTIPSFYFYSYFYSFFFSFFFFFFSFLSSYSCFLSLILLFLVPLSSPLLSFSWIRLMTKKGTPYLREYTLKSPSVFNNQLIQAAGGQEIYLVQNSTKFPFSGMSAFIKMGFDTDQVRILPIEVLALIPQGPPI